MTATLASAVLAFSVARADDAKALFDQKCASCHGKEGRGETKMGKKLEIKDYSDAKVQAGFTDEEAVKAIKDGVKDSSGKDKMKAYGDALSDDQIKGLVAYVRTLKK